MTLTKSRRSCMASKSALGPQGRSSRMALTKSRDQKPASGLQGGMLGPCQRAGRTPQGAAASIELDVAALRLNNGFGALRDGRHGPLDF